MVGKSTPVRKAGKNLDVAVGYPFRSLGGPTSPLVIHHLDRVYQDSDLAMTGCSVSILRNMTTTNRSGRHEIGRAQGGERVCQYVYVWVADVSLNKTTIKKNEK